MLESAYWLSIQTDLRLASGRTDHKSGLLGCTPNWSHPYPVMSVAGALVALSALAVGLAYQVDFAVVEDDADVDRSADMVRARPGDARLDLDLQAYPRGHRTPALQQPEVRFCTK